MLRKIRGYDVEEWEAGIGRTGGVQNINRRLEDRVTVEPGPETKVREDNASCRSRESSSS
jgi:hypothetical protein